MKMSVWYHEWYPVLSVEDLDEDREDDDHVVDLPAELIDRYRAAVSEFDEACRAVESFLGQERVKDLKAG